jgi:hypothetical protein
MHPATGHLVVTGVVAVVHAVEVLWGAALAVPDRLGPMDAEVDAGAWQGRQTGVDSHEPYTRMRNNTTRAT